MFSVTITGNTWQDELSVTLNCSLLGGSRIHQEITHFLEAVPGFRARGVMEVQVFKWSIFCGRVWENDRSVDNGLRFLQKL